MHPTGAGANLGAWECSRDPGAEEICSPMVRYIEDIPYKQLLLDSLKAKAPWSDFVVNGVNSSVSRS